MIQNNVSSSKCSGCGRTFLCSHLLFEGRVIASSRFCGECTERHERSRAIERDQRERARLDEAWEKICPPLYRETDPTRLECPEAAQKAVLDWEYGPKGLLVHGPARAGKTRLVYLLLSRLHHLGKHRIMALSSTAFSHEIAQRFGSGGGSGEDFVNRLTKVPILFIDDFGKGRLTDRVESEFFHVIETRTTHLRPTILTTNYNGETLRSVLSVDRAEALLGRFHEFFQAVAVIKEAAI